MTWEAVNGTGGGFKKPNEKGIAMTAHTNRHRTSDPDVRQVNETTFKKLLKEKHVPDEQLLVHSDNGRSPRLAAMQRYWAPWYSIEQITNAGLANAGLADAGLGDDGLAVRVRLLDEPLLPWDEHHAFQKLVDRVLQGKRQGIRATAARIIGPAPAHRWVVDSSLDPQSPASDLETGQWVELYRLSQAGGFGNLSGGRSVGVDHKPRQASGRQGAREPKLRW